MKSNKLAYAIILLFIMAVVVANAPFIYNYHIHPLARQSKEISLGHDIKDVEKMLEGYRAAYRTNGQPPQLTVKNPDLTCDYKGEGLISGCISIMDDSVFDSIFLDVFFDEQGKVIEVRLVGD